MSDNLTPKQKATLATWGISVDDNGVVRSNAAVGPLDASPDSGSAEQEARDRLAVIGFAETERRIATLKAELAEAMIAMGLTGYDHREDVATPAQCIYALWSDHTNLRELHAMQGAAITSLEAELAAAREREAALAIVIQEAPPDDPPLEWRGALGVEYRRGREETWQYFEARFTEAVADPAPILASVRREAKREDLRKVKAAAEECIKVMLFESSRHDRVSRDSYCEGVQDVIADIDAALAALDVEEMAS